MIYLKLFLTFLKIGAFTFGGGYAMLPLIQQEVLHHGWLGQEELIDFIAISESTPGPFAVNVSTFVGMQTAGVFGALCATLGVVFPSFVIILIVAKVFDRFKQSRIVKGAMVGLKGVVVGLIGSAILTTVRTLCKTPFAEGNYAELAVGVVLLILFFVGLKKKVSPILVLLISAVAGIAVKMIL